MVFLEDREKADVRPDSGAHQRGEFPTMRCAALLPAGMVRLQSRSVALGLRERGPRLRLPWSPTGEVRSAGLLVVVHSQVCVTCALDDLGYALLSGSLLSSGRPPLGSYGGCGSPAMAPLDCCSCTPHRTRRPGPLATRYTLSRPGPPCQPG